MKRKVLCKVLATTMACTVALVPALTVCAEDVTEPVVVGDGETRVIDGNVNVTVESLIEAPYGIDVDGGNVTVHGDVNVTDEAPAEQWYAAAADVTSGGQVTIDGDVTFTSHSNGGSAISVSQGIAVVKGSVTHISDPTDHDMDGVEDNYSALGDYKGSIIVGGDVNSNSHVARLNEADLFVGGDAYATDAGVIIEYDASLGDQNAVVIDGTLKSDGTIFKLEGFGLDSSEYVEDVFPCIIVYAIDKQDDKPMVESELYRYGWGHSDFIDENNDGFDDNTDLSEEGFIRESAYSGEEKQEMEALFKSAINYIIRTEGDVELTGEHLINTSDFLQPVADALNMDTNFTTTRIDDTFTATVGPNYELRGDSSVVEVCRESDGVYSVKLINERGGILLRAVAIEADQSTDQTPGQGTDQTPGQGTDQTPGQGTDQTPGQSTDQGQNSGQTVIVIIPVDSSSDNTNDQGTTPSSSTPSAGAVVVSTAAGAGASSKNLTFKMSELTDEQFKSAVVNNIDSTPAGSTLRLETDRVACFDRAMLEAFAKKNINLEVVFPSEGSKLKVVIPAGYDINKLLDDKGYCGFLKLAGILGSEVA